jgi:hypothetical protein
MEGESRIAHIIESAYLSRSEGVYVATLTMYIDDSGTSPKHEVAVAAGWISPVRQWKKFEKEWEKAKIITGDEFDCFHMSPCVYSGKKTEFATWSYTKKQRVIRRLRNIIKRRAMKGFCSAIRKKDYDELVPLELKEERGRHHYTWVMRNVLGQIHRWREDNNVTDPIEYIFDWMKPTDPRRVEIQNAFAPFEENPEAQKRFGLYKGCCNFRERCEVAPLQAADILAWLLYRGTLHREAIQGINEIALESLADFAGYQGGEFVIGGNSTRNMVAKWVAGALRERGKTW